MFGNRLKELRKQKKISQESLGEMLGVTSNAVYSWEVGKAQPSIEVIKTLADFFQVSIDYLLGYEQTELDEIDKLKTALKEAGLMFGEDLTKEELEKALKIVEMIKEK